MEEWYRQQYYFTEERMLQIQAWMSQGVIDIFSYNIEINASQMAAG